MHLIWKKGGGTFKPMLPKFKHWTTSAPTYCINNNGALHANIFQYKVHYYFSLVKNYYVFRNIYFELFLLHFTRFRIQLCQQIVWTDERYMDVYTDGNHEMSLETKC